MIKSRTEQFKPLSELTSYLTESDSSVNAANEVLEKLTKQTEAAVHKIDIAIERAVEVRSCQEKRPNKLLPARMPKGSL